MKSEYALFDLSCLCLIVGVQAAETGVVQKTKYVVQSGAEATVHGTEHGAKAVGNGLSVGMNATARGIQRSVVDAAARRSEVCSRFHSSITFVGQLTALLLADTKEYPMAA